MDNEKNVQTVIEHADIPLEGPFYNPNDVHAHVSLEIRDFSTPDRTLVIRSWVEGEVVSTMVSLAKFEEAFDGMRARMLMPDWDDALQQIAERGN